MSPHAALHPARLAHAGEGLQAAGFRFDRQEGSHRSYVKTGVARPVVIPAYREVPVFVIHNNLKTAGISRESYFQLLERHR